ncbi:DUF3800 domain-containing protein [Staphylococcus aureus]|uniref:DUF3800 domain-containing protein n=1 Tax=Staphylococcus aureus TaxID=1280 RepID=UPI0011BE42BF|nr:DUF3800 domain-containing protein [Staphylococcus aureus]MCS5330803.1 DUF3800 domain-containing protein [Staphylococcus aureus]QOW91953.1 DUF3800 domain-containing protein [Staphylococcus aureus]QOY74684.1 DUF3800 domain-containing protein [Staphylococcus aureus]HEH7944432.1 DUF3800 domain-containing protein [Staphylococcus aureus]
MEIKVALDESGNFGQDGDYVVVGGLQVFNSKPIHNFMKKQELKFRKMYPENFEGKEIKHNNSYPAMRYHYINKIVEKTEKIHYCTSNKRKCDPKMLEDENILYNYMVFRIVKRIIIQNPTLEKLTLLLDNRTTKITRRDSLVDYLKGKVYFDLNRPDVELMVIMLDSENSRLIQAADFIAGSVYHYYTYNNNLCYNLLKEKLDCKYHYPYNDF